MSQNNVGGGGDFFADWWLTALSAQIGDIWRVDLCSLTAEETNYNANNLALFNSVFVEIILNSLEVSSEESF